MQLTKAMVVTPSAISRINTNPGDHALGNFTRVLTTTTVSVRPQTANELIHRRDNEQKIDTSLRHNNTHVNDTTQTASNQPGNPGWVSPDTRPVPRWGTNSTNGTNPATNGTAGNTTTNANGTVTNATTNATVPVANTTVPCLLYTSDAADE